MPSLSRFDVQAKVGLVVSCVAASGALALAAILMRNFNRNLWAIVYGSKTYYSPFIFGATAGIMLLALAGTALGANSAGQRRNERQKWSWVAFFLGAATLSLTVVLFAAFWWYGLPLAG